MCGVCRNCPIERPFNHIPFLGSAKIGTPLLLLPRQESSRRLEKLLDGTSKEVQALYALADVATIKEVFLQRYLDQLPAPPPAAAGKQGPAAWDPTSPSVSDERPPELRRGDSARGLAPTRAGSRGRLTPQAGPAAAAGVSWSGHDEEDLVVLSKELCERLAPAGKPAVSVWQLHRLVDTLFPDDPRAAVAHAHLLTDPRPVVVAAAAAAAGAASGGKAAAAEEAQAPAPAPASAVAAAAARWRGAMSARGLLRRLGMETYAYELEDGGYAWAEELRGLTADDVVKCGVKEKRDAEAVVDVLAMKVRGGRGGGGEGMRGRKREPEKGTMGEGELD
jgi:hypothetical protein